MLGTQSLEKNQSGNGLRRNKPKLCDFFFFNLFMVSVFFQVQSSSSCCLSLDLCLCAVFLLQSIQAESFNLWKTRFSDCSGSWIKQLPKARLLVLYVFVDLSQPPVRRFIPIPVWKRAVLNFCSSKDGLLSLRYLL